MKPALYTCTGIKNIFNDIANNTEPSKTCSCLLYTSNIVTEEKSGNIFIVKDGIVLTHPNGGKILPGITKQLIIELLHQHNIPVWEKEFSEEELLHADEVMVTDTNSEIVPVIKVNDIIIGNLSLIHI